MEKDKYAAQKKYLAANRKKVNVWVEAEKYETFKALVKENGDSIYGLVNKLIDDYLEEHKK